MGRTTIEVAPEVRDELRSYKADHKLTYDETLLRLLDESGWDFRHADFGPDGDTGNDN